MRLVAVCPSCGEKRMNLVTETGSDRVEVVCSQCKFPMGAFSEYALEKEKSDDAE